MLAKLQKDYMNSYKNLVKKFIKNKYKESTIFSKNFYRKYKAHRSNLLYTINNLRFYLPRKQINNDQTYNNLKNIYLKNSNNIKLKNVLIYYKKFEVNVALKKIYNRSYVKRSNIETNYNSYIFLGLLISKNNKLNSYQKINCMLKIIDKLSLNIQLVEKNNLNLFKKLLTQEKKLIDSLN
tara:strand:+ start:2193 stop:2735 length:543 start_codon:yes stop_codon:yes gene_type:complete